MWYVSVCRDVLYSPLPEGPIIASNCPGFTIPLISFKIVFFYKTCGISTFTHTTRYTLTPHATRYTQHTAPHHNTHPTLHRMNYNCDDEGKCAVVKHNRQHRRLEQTKRGKMIRTSGDPSRPKRLKMLRWEGAVHRTWLKVTYAEMVIPFISAKTTTLIYNHLMEMALASHQDIVLGIHLRWRESVWTS